MHEMEQLRKESMTALRLEALERERAAVRRVRDEADAALAAEREASEEAMQALGQEEEDRVRRKVKEAQRAWERQRAQLEGQVRAGLQQLAAQEKQVLPPAPTLPRTKWTRRVPHPVLIGHATSHPHPASTLASAPARCPGRGGCPAARAAPCGRGV
jgi:hypothetical protein